MRKFISILLCLIILCCTVACDRGDVSSESDINSNTTLSEAEINPNTTQESSTEKTLPYAFISKQERLEWKDKIINVISANDLYEDYEILQHNFLGMALMDLNYDNAPEVVAAYAGGSMGNVCLVAYDFNSGEQLCTLGDTPHYQDWDNAYFCHYRNDEGKYILVNEGSLRDGLEWYMITSSLNNQFKFDALFEEVKSSDDSIRYYCYGNEVEKAEFEQQKNQFKNDYKEIKKTQIQIIYWDAIDAKNKSDAISAMADALINSEQEFIKYNIDYKAAYLDFLKDKEESHRLFSLVYIDNDDIPELYLSGVSEAEGDMICSFKNGVVVYQYLSRIGGGKYVEKSESIINQNGHMGQYYDNVYKLDENGFSEVLNARYKEIYEHIGNEEYNIYYEYFIDDTAVSEVEYNNAVNAAFDFSKAISFYDNAVSYEKIVEQLGGDNSVG